MITTLASLFEKRATSKGDSIALYWGDRQFTFKEIEERTRGLGQHLLGPMFNVKRGDRVGILLRNSPDFIVALYAAYRIGATVVPINTFLKPDELRHIITDANIETLITHNDFSETLTDMNVVRRIPLNNILRVDDPNWENLQKPLKDVALTPPEEKDLALLVYTSGTTGKPKGVMLSHTNVSSNVASCWRSLHPDSKDRVLLALPMFHSFMLTVGISLPLSSGASIVLIKSLEQFRFLLDEVLDREVTIFLGIPQIYRAMALTKIPMTFHWKCKCRVAISGSAPLPVETLEAFNKKFKFPLIEGYGLSEASPVVSLNPVDGKQKPGSVGFPLTGITVAILDDRDVELKKGEIGEICVAGPNVMRGYWNQPEETAVTLRNRWLHTGDLGRVDEDGYIYVVDRKKDMLLVNGQNVYPREIEEVLYQFEGIREAAVIGRPDRKGEVPIAFVVAEEGAKLSEPPIREFCKKKLADYKLPREVMVIPKLPRNAMGKVDKRELHKFLD